MADQELLRVRPDFVKNVSSPVIYKLLGRLRQYYVLTDMENDFILEGILTRADKARYLIDVMWRKGNKASMKMIYHLQDIDPFLYTKLGLSSAHPGQSAKPNPSVSTVEEFSKTKKNDPKVYPVTQTSFRNRIALLITNIKFSEGKLNRWGAEEDEENMEKLLSSLGYEVVKYTNLTEKAIDEALIEFTQHPKLKQTDSVFVVIMSHGKLGKILGVDWREDNPDEFQINKIFKRLGSKSCPTLIDKPKVIIIQACRGERIRRFLLSESPNTADYDDLEVDELHCAEKDFICLLSCMPGEHPYWRTLLIQHFVEVFSPESYQKDIYELLMEVIISLEPYYSGPGQMPSITRCTLTKLFYPLKGIRDGGASAMEDKDTVTDKLSECEGSSYGASTDDSQEEEEEEDSAPISKFCCETCKSITQTCSTELFTPQRISEGHFEMHLEGEGTYECSITGLVFEASERVLVRYSVLSWSEFHSFLSSSWKVAGPIFNIDIVDKEASVLSSIHLPHSICLTHSPDNAVPFRILHVKDEAFIEPSSDYSGSHVKWNVTPLSPVGPIIPVDVQVEYHGVVLIYKPLCSDTNNCSFHVYLATNDASSINDIKQQVQEYNSPYIRIDKPPTCKLVEGTYHLSSEPEGEIGPKELEFTRDPIKIKGYFEAVFEDQPPFKWSLIKKSTDEVVWSHYIREGDLKQKPRKRAKCRRVSDRSSLKAYGARPRIQRDQDLSERQLLLVAQKFGSEWKQAPIFLGLQNRDLDDIQDTEKDVKMQKHKMLVKWKKGRKRGEATAFDLWESLKDLENLSTEVRDMLQVLMDEQAAS